ncbi:MAG TPA: choice-of-anchor D domain-containing protein [Acidisarcina sp.]|nr:choice-of-anchor D domain-containing protein [Acidisarcina sp.]
MRNNPLSRVKIGSMARLLPAVLILAATPAVKAATAPIVFSGLESSPFGGTFQSATSAATDATGNLYVSEPNQNRVSMVAPDGTRTVLSISGLSAPVGLAVDSGNNLWVANSGANNVIRHPLGGGGDATLSGFSTPYNLAADAAGNVYVSNAATNTVSKISGGVVTPLVSGGLGGIRGLAVDSADNLYIGISGSGQVVDVSATTGTVKGTITPSSSCQVFDLSVNPTGDLFVACGNKSVIYRVPNEAGILTVADQSVVASSAIPGSAGVHGLAFGGGTLYATSGQSIVDKIQLDSVNLGSFAISSPTSTLAATATLNFSAITTSSIGSVVAFSEGIAQSNPAGPADYRISSTGTTCPVNGGSLGAGSTCTVTITYYPNGVGVRHGGVLFSDSGNQQLFNLPLFGIGLGSRVAYGPSIINAFDPTVAGQSLNGPVAIQVDGAGNRVVVDILNNRVVKFDQQLTTGSVVGTGLTLPNGVAIDGSGNVYIADSAAGILMVPNENGTLNSAHQSVVTTDVSLPSGMRFDRAGNLYVADAFNNRVIKIPFEDGKVNGLHQTTVGSGFVQPNGVAIDPSGTVYVADTGNNRVVRVAPNGAQSTVSIDIGQINNLALEAPGDVTLDAAGDLYISDTNNYRIIYVSADGLVQAVVPGAQTPSQPGYGAFGGIWIDPIGWLYIPDFLANRIEEVQNFPFPLNFPLTPIGATSQPQVIQTSNIGNTPLSIKKLSFPKDFQQQSVGSAPVPDCSGTSTLASGTSCLIGVVFQPSKSGTFQENLNVVNDDLNTPPPYNTDVFPLSGTAQSILSVTPLSLTFAVTPDGSVSAAQTLTITNLTKSSTSLTFSFTGSNPSDFGISSQTCGSTLAGKTSCTVSVVFKPVLPENGARSAQLLIASGVAGGSVTVALNGTATIPALVASPNSLTFPPTPEFTQSQMAFTLTNLTFVPVYLRFSTTLNPVAFTPLPSPGCNGLIAANSSCTVGVIFRPTVYDPINPANNLLTDVLTVLGSTDGINYNFSTTVSLAGVVTAPPAGVVAALGKVLPNARVTLSPSNVSFGQQSLFTAASTTLNVTNHTGLASYLSLTVPTGYAANSSCPAVLKSGTSCQVTLSFRPDTAGSHDGYLTTTLIPVNGSASHSSRVSVSGTGK